MSTFVILAAGKGTRIGRVGEALHKALVPLGGRAVLSHLFDLAPHDSRLVVCVGHRAEQIIEYVRLAHPETSARVTYVHVNPDEPGAGPGTTLLAAREVVGDDDLVFTSCDTLWEDDPSMWRFDGSWAAVAPVPAGTPAARWCRLETDELGRVTGIWDKRPGGAQDMDAYVGLARVSRDHLERFWSGVERGDVVAGERQVSGGFAALLGDLRAMRVTWTDVGDETSYRRAVARVDGYDWTKIGEATYLLPREGRVVKFWSNVDVRWRRLARAVDLKGVVPHVLDTGAEMLAYEYVPGRTIYEVLDDKMDIELVRRICDWLLQNVWEPRNVDDHTMRDAAYRFYRDKTFGRIARLETDLRRQCEDILARINWDELVEDVHSARIHGDVNFGNVILSDHDTLFGIDWREDFAGETDWGDARYDAAKLLAGTRVHWGNARRGDFRPWDAGKTYAQEIERRLFHGRVDVHIIAALSLINSAPLHASPLDEVLVARGTAWLEEVLR